MRIRTREKVFRRFTLKTIDHMMECHHVMERLEEDNEANLATILWLGYLSAWKTFEEKMSNN